ncbi:hypothetical protein RI367_002823 [Sorochytrium milnesiophthora]
MDTAAAALKRERPAGVDKHPHKRLKRTPFKSAVLAGDIYVTIKTPMKAYIKRAKKLLDEDKISQVVLHGIGKCITKTVQLAVALQSESLGEYTLDTTTGTVDLVDTIEYDDQDLDIEQDVRQTSSIRIVVKRRKT